VKVKIPTTGTRKTAPTPLLLRRFRARLYRGSLGILVR
jgi:hypothetical protein